jgi:hypothetical protein
MVLLLFWKEIRNDERLDLGRGSCMDRKFRGLVIEHQEYREGEV